MEYAFIDDGLFITFIGPAETNAQVVNGIAEEGFSGGGLIGFNDVDGSIAWKLEIPDAVDAIEQVDGQLIIASLAKVLIVDSQTGKLVHTIETGTKKPIYRPRITTHKYGISEIIFISNFKPSRRVHAIKKLV